MPLTNNFLIFHIIWCSSGYTRFDHKQPASVAKIYGGPMLTAAIQVLVDPYLAMV